MARPSSRKRTRKEITVRPAETVPIESPPEYHSPATLGQAARDILAPRIAVLAGIMDGVSTIRLREKCPKCGHVPPDAEKVLPDSLVRPSDQISAARTLAQISADSKDAITTTDALRFLQGVRAELIDALGLVEGQRRWDNAMQHYAALTQPAT